jgi:nicotinate-nucleotide adenylyltransferase
MKVSALHESIKHVYFQVFGKTPLAERLDDIVKQANRLSRYKDINDLKMYTGNLLASTIQLCNENGFDNEQLIRDTLNGILDNKEIYKKLGRKKHIAIFGGAFDPPTLAHFRTAQFVLNESRWADEVWMVPAFGHMYGKNMADPIHRLDMCRIATKSDRRIKVSEFEIEHELTGETYKTAKKLSEEYPDYEFAFVIGQDNANTIEKWVNSEYLVHNAMFIVIPREGIAPDLSVKWYNVLPHISLIGLKSNIGEISSTGYKVACIKNEDVSKYVIPEIHEYVMKHKLYEV